MRLENARFAVEQLGVEERKNMRAELREAAPIVGKVFAHSERETATLVAEIAHACKMKR